MINKAWKYVACGIVQWVIAGVALADNLDALSSAGQELKAAMAQDKAKDCSDYLRIKFDNYVQSVIKSKGLDLSVPLLLSLDDHVMRYESVKRQLSYYADILSVLEEIAAFPEMKSETWIQLEGRTRFFQNIAEKMLTEMPEGVPASREKFERASLDQAEFLLTSQGLEYGRLEAIDKCKEILNLDYFYCAYRADVLRVRAQIRYRISGFENQFTEEQFKSMLLPLVAPKNPEDKEAFAVLVSELSFVESVIEDGNLKNHIASFVRENSDRSRWAWQTNSFLYDDQETEAGKPTAP
jgi:hypothetical protein